MSAKPKVLFVGGAHIGQIPRVEFLADSVEVVQMRSPVRALARLANEEFAGVYVSRDHLSAALKLGKLLERARVLESLPDGVALLDSENTILWANRRLREWGRPGEVEGCNFYTALGSPEILGPDFCPFHTALATGASSSSTLRSSDNRYYRVHAAPVLDAARLVALAARGNAGAGSLGAGIHGLAEQSESEQGASGHGASEQSTATESGNHGNVAVAEADPAQLIVTVRDVTADVLQQQKLAEIHQAGVELANLTPDELLHMTVDERIELLKANILHYTQDLLNFDVVEIRLLDSQTGLLEPLLSVGLVPEAVNRALYAEPQGNGVTGFVAATGKSYLCEDTTEDPLYLEGARGAKSSLTVPLALHNLVIGTFNVESPEPRAFTDSHLQFLEVFARDVAMALNTLELLVAEKASTAQESVEAIHSAVALPVDDILNDAVNVMERYIGHEPEVAERLQRILRNARDIKQVIQKVGQKMAPTQAHPQALQAPERPSLRGRQILVADADDTVRLAAHSLLERYGCVVETTHSGGEAIYMVRNLVRGASYDVLIADIRLPDMTGYDFLLKLQEMMDFVPLVLMTGYGYDPGHSIANARRAGHPAQWILYKPFRLDQLLDTVEQVVRAPKPPRQS